MLFNKYQYSKNVVSRRGYAQTCVVSDENNKKYWVKWILGIDKSSIKSKILADKLRHLQKARHLVLPEIVDYGFDDEEQTFAVVFDYIESVGILEDAISEIKTQNFIGGLMEMADCLMELHINHRINHGDLHPGNILVDKNGQFYIIDFGLTDITKTLSQEKDLEIFAKSFAAPEKLNYVSRGFPFQSDIYSFGKIVEWYFQVKQENIPESQSRNLQLLLAQDPVDRLNWQQAIDFLKDLSIATQTEYVYISSRCELSKEFWKSLQNEKPRIDIYPNSKENFVMDIIVGGFICEKAQWLKKECILIINEIKPLASYEQKIIELKLRESKKIPSNITFSIDEKNNNRANITPFLQSCFNNKQTQISLRNNRKAVFTELSFYRELLEKELEVIASNSLRLQYSSYKIKGDEISFSITPNEKYSNVGVVLKHIEEGNDINSDGFEYIISANSDKKQNKKAIQFIGKPYDWVQLIDENKSINDVKRFAFKIKDCEHLTKDSIPLTGFIFESIAKKEEEKKRQLDAITRVDRNDVQNPSLIYSLFKPDELKTNCSFQINDLSVKQKDASGTPFIYSYNQNKAIQNALNCSPFSVIQGPPGTGKTTIITEIVFQILSKQPESKILITSQTNNAVDQVLENLIKNNISILRLSGISSPKIPCIRDHTLEMKLSGWKKQVTDASESNFLRRKNQYRDHYGDHFLSLENLHKDWIATILSLEEKSSINQKLIDSIRVIGATCNHIAAKKYTKFNFEFDYVIMDESGKATTAEALVPIITGKNLVFVGDHRQLRPMLTSSREIERWLREKYKREADEIEDWDDYFNRPSLFEQVISRVDSDYKSQLTECRRSSKDQVLLTSKCFYEPMGDEAIDSVGRIPDMEHKFPLAIDSSILFVDIGSHYINEVENKSSYNAESLKVVPQILELLNNYEQSKEYSFGVITAYTAQYRKLVNRVSSKDLKRIRQWKKNEEKLTVSVIDRFQGLERDVVIVDLVKSGPGLSLGFMETPNRINVALSRQKKLLIIVGDYHSIVNANTRKGEKVALQSYLEKIKPEWIIKSDQISDIFPKYTEDKNEDLGLIANPRKKIDFELIKNAVTKSWNSELGKIELASFLNAMVQQIKGFKLKDFGYKNVDEFCEEYGFTKETITENGKVYLIPEFDFEKSARPQKYLKIKQIPFEVALNAFHKCSKNESGLVNTKQYYLQLCEDIKHFNPLEYGGRFNEFYKKMDVFDIIIIDKDTKFLKLKDSLI
jgi:tRNA A-37 threonylcarbamoyl transferase component Bud32